MIDITGVDLVKFAQKVYELSVPQGLGWLHANSDPLSEDKARELLMSAGSLVVLSMDYVNGRACKMNVFREGDRLQIKDSWYDHTDDQLHVLLSSFNISPPKPVEHGLACNCRRCQQKRRTDDQFL